MNTRNSISILVMLISVQIGRSDPLDSWTWRNPLPTGNTLMSVAYGNGQFVAVGDAGTIQTSTNGVDWVLRQSGTFNGLFDVVYANDGFVAVGYGGTILASADGAHWTQRHSGTTNQLATIAYGNNRFLAYTGRPPFYETTVYSSADLTNWVQASVQSVPACNIGQIAYGNGQFVAAGVSGIIAGGLVSTDGVNWDWLPTTIGLGISGITYGDGQFVAVGAVDDNNPPGRLITSVDGTNWVQQQLGATNRLVAVAYGNGRYIASGENEILTSTNGVDWAARETSYAPSAIVYGNGTFVGVGDGTLTSTDGTDWVQHQTWTRGDLFGITYGNGQFVAVGYNGIQASHSILTSADGANWVQRQVGSTNGFNAVTYGNGQFVAVGGWVSPSYSPGTIFTSTDATNWVQRSEGTTNWLNAVTFGNGRFVAVGGFVPWAPSGGFGGPGTILTSTDAVNWTPRPVGSTNSLYAVAYGNGQFAAVGGTPYYNGVGGLSTILTSSDGENWVQRQCGATDALSAIAYGNGQFVALYDENIIVTSPDGVNWTSPQAANQAYLSAIAYSNGEFVGVGPYYGGNASILTSNDGTNWIPHQSGAANELSGVAYGDGHFVAVGEGGTILESGSLITLSLTPNPGGGSLSLALTGPSGLAYAIQRSSDLISWQTVTNITLAQPTTVVLDTSPLASDHVYYRAYSQ